MMEKLKALLVVCLTVLLAACGGGGDSGSSSSGGSSSANSFNLLSGYQRLVAAGQSSRLTISGGCSGTFSNTTSPANQSATFEGQSALAAVSVNTFTYSNCTPATAATTVTSYYNSNYIPSGQIGSNYGVWASPPVIPSTVKVGDAGVIGSINFYTNSSKTLRSGREDDSYVIEADTSTTAIFNLISKTYDSFGGLVSTEQDRYRISPDGSLKLLSIDIAYGYSGLNLSIK